MSETALQKYLKENPLDGLHSKRLLAQKWLRRLQFDIIKECWVNNEAFAIHVDPQELQSL